MAARLKKFLSKSVKCLSRQIHNAGDNAGAAKLAQHWLACLVTRCDEDLKAQFCKERPMLDEDTLSQAMSIMVGGYY